MQNILKLLTLYQISFEIMKNSILPSSFAFIGYSSLQCNILL